MTDHHRAQPYVIMHGCLNMSFVKNKAPVAIRLLNSLHDYIIKSRFQKPSRTLQEIT